jgi:hypothetical protein
LEISPLTTVAVAATVVFALLLAARARRRQGHITKAAATTEIAIAGMLSVNVAAMLGFGWWIASILIHDGVMIVELGICAALIAVLALVTGRALALKRRGKLTLAAGLLAVAALPSIAIYLFLLYLDSNPINMR